MANPTRSKLNPNAIPFTPDSYCLFLTFSNGFPLEYEEVRDLFRAMYPDQIRSVYVHKPGPDGDKKKLWGKVVFNHPNMADSMFYRFPGQKFDAKPGYPIHFKRFDSSRANTNNRGGAPPPSPPSPSSQ